MLTSEEVNRLFDLLEQLYQGKKKTRDRATVAIWAAVLEPWDYGQVRDAAVRRSRVNRYFPDPSELAEYLPAAPERKTCAAGLGYADSGVEALRGMHQRLVIKRKARGIPATVTEALAAGMAGSAWCEALEQAGLALWREVLP